MVTNMSQKQNIDYRNSLLQKLKIGERLSSSEKIWLQVNPAYNVSYGEDALAFDILQLHPNAKYSVQLSLKDMNPKGIFQSWFTCVLGDGVISIPGDSKKYQSIRFRLTKDEPTITFDFYSENGLARVEYAQIYETNNSTGINSVKSDWYPKLAMKKKELSKNKIAYSCKSKDNEDFNSFIFIIEIKKYDCLACSGL